MPDTTFAVPMHAVAARRATRSLLFALLTLAAPIGCVTTRVVERPAGDGAMDLPEAPPYRTVDDPAWSNGASREAPDVRVWMVSDETYQRGDRIRSLFRMREDGYVTIVRIDTDGRMRILYPRTPTDDGWVNGGRTYRVPGYENASFLIDDPTGVGYVFAISSYKPFDYSRYAVGARWDYVALSARVHGDPFVAMRAFAERIAPDDYTGYATDFAEYYVDRRVDYPRYAYPDCGSLPVGVIFDPYDGSCTRYVVIVYDDSYYPYRHYPGTRVVYMPRPHYEFKRVNPTPSNPQQKVVWVEHRRRPVDVDPRRPGNAGDPNGRPGRIVIGDPGSRRPGDDATPGGNGGHRRPDDPGSSSSAPPHYGAGFPRRDSSRVNPPTGAGSGGNGNGVGNGVGNGGGNGNGNGGNVGNANPGNGDDRADHGRGPRRDPATTRDDGHDRGRGRGDGAGRDDTRRTGDDSAATTRRLPAPFQRMVPPRRGEPRADAPRPDAPSSDAPRAESEPGTRTATPASPVTTPATPAATAPADGPAQRGGNDAQRAPVGEPSRGGPPPRDEPRADAPPRNDSRASDAPPPQGPPADRGRPASSDRSEDGRGRSDGARNDGAKSDAGKSDSTKDGDRPSRPDNGRRRIP